MSDETSIEYAIDMGTSLRNSGNKRGEFVKAVDVLTPALEQAKATIATLTAENELLQAALKVSNECVANSNAAIKKATASLTSQQEQLAALTAERDQLRKELAAAKAVVEDAGKIMALLSKYGKDIVPHLMDTDDNPGERIRRALAAKEASNDKR